MSDSADIRRESKVQQLAARLTSAEGGRLWTAADLTSANDAGLTPASLFVPGDRFALSTPDEYFALGFNQASPQKATSLRPYLDANRLSLQTYQDTFGALPVRFNNDGTATFDPSAQRNAFDFDNGDGMSFGQWLAMAATIYAGGTFLSGGSLFGAAEGASSVGYVNSFDSGAMGSILGTAAGEGASAAGLLAENSFDSGAMNQVLTRTSTLTVPPGAGSLLDAIKTGASITSSAASLTGTIRALTADAPTFTATGASSSPAGNPLVLNLGATDMAAKPNATASTPIASNNMQQLVTLGIVALIAFAVLQELGGE